jgi:pimeloyl-ACP methyl ester carboxylesterase
MAAYVLIHGGSVDGSVWKDVGALLRAGGHRVFAPTLSDERTSGLSAHVREVCATIEEAGTDGIVLAGHSYGGMVITGAADRAASRIGRMIYIDAALPEPGQSLFDVLRAAGCVPDSFKGLDPYPPYVEKLFFDPAVLSKIPKLYIRCTRSVFAAVGTHAAATVLRRQEQDNWSYAELAADHSPMISMPGKLVELF